MSYILTETLGRRVKRREEHATQEQAIDAALGWAEAEDLIRDDDAADDFMALRPSWTREELREQLVSDGSFEFDNIKVAIRQQP